MPDAIRRRFEVSAAGIVHVAVWARPNIGRRPIRVNQQAAALSVPDWRCWLQWRNMCLNMDRVCGESALACSHGSSGMTSALLILCDSVSIRVAVDVV